MGDSEGGGADAAFAMMAGSDNPYVKLLSSVQAVVTRQNTLGTTKRSPRKPHPPRPPPPPPAAADV